jgi:hypothetical protein
MRELQDIELKELKCFYNSLIESFTRPKEMDDVPIYKCIMLQMYPRQNGHHYSYDGWLHNYSLVVYKAGNEETNLKKDFLFTFNKLKKVITTKERKEKIKKLLS